eukprot:gene10791-biopygen1972
MVSGTVQHSAAQQGALKYSASQYCTSQHTHQYISIVSHSTIWLRAVRHQRSAVLCRSVPFDVGSNARSELHPFKCTTGIGCRGVQMSCNAKE